MRNVFPRMSIMKGNSLLDKVDLGIRSISSEKAE